MQYFNSLKAELQSGPEAAGISEQDVIDPVIDQHQHVMRFISRNNTLTYRMVFHAFPDDSEKMANYPYKKTASLKAEPYLKKNICGLIIDHPISNLREKIDHDNLDFKWSEAEYFINTLVPDFFY